ncbi:MAG TPA: biotin/lipoyl-containing protein [Gemmatimonadales bacterium]
MKYIVSIAGRSIEVEVEGEQVRVGGRSHSAALRAAGDGLTRQLLIDGRPRTLTMRSAGRGQWTLNVGGDRWEVEVIDERTRHIRSLTAGGERVRGPAALRAPMPGLVVRVLVEPGQEVEAGTGLVVLEAMKMENELKASAGGTVSAIRSQAGEAVEKGQVLVEFQ